MGRRVEFKRKAKKLKNEIKKTAFRNAAVLLLACAPLGCGKGEPLPEGKACMPPEEKKERGADIGMLIESADGKLFKAVINRDYERAVKAIEEGADVDGNRLSMGSYLYELAEDRPNKKSLRIAGLLLENGADVNRGTVIETPLETACRSKNKEMFELFMEYEPVITRDAVVCIAEGDMKGSDEIMFKLLENGIDPDMSTPNGYTLLHYSVFGMEKGDNMKMIKLLMKAGAKPSIRDKLGNTPLDIAIQWSLAAGLSGETVVAERFKNAVYYLEKKEAGCSEDWKFRYAINTGDIKTVGKMIKNGADVNSDDGKGNTPIFYALKHPEVVKLLIRNGADVNAKNDRDESPLLASANDPNRETIYCLLINGAEAKFFDENNNPKHRKVLKTGSYDIAGIETNPFFSGQEGWAPVHVYLKSN